MKKHLGKFGNNNPNNNFWKNKKVFLTGHTGFKGTWMHLWLSSLGANVSGYSIDLGSNPSFFKKINTNYNQKEVGKDINNLIQLKNDVRIFNPDIIVHMAAQSLVLTSYKKSLETHRTNIIGTANIFEASKNLKKLKTICIVTSDKCYENNNKLNQFTESSNLGGNDPYSASKAAAEIIAHSYYQSFFKEKKINVFSVRAGNVIGGGDWSKNRIIPDIIRSYKNKKKIIIRNPNHIRPWQHVLDPLNAYLNLIEKSFSSADIVGGWNVAPSIKKEKNVKWIVDYCCKIINLKKYVVLSKKKYSKENKYLGTK